MKGIVSIIVAFLIALGIFSVGTTSNKSKFDNTKFGSDGWHSVKSNK